MFSSGRKGWTFGLLQNRGPQEESQNQSMQMTSIAWTDDDVENR